MEKDDLLNEMNKWARIAHSSNPVLELDIHKILKSLKEEMGATPEEIKALSEALYHPETIQWNIAPPLPERPLQYDPTERDIQFIKDLIASGATKWGIPGTAQPGKPETALHYAIDHQKKTFKVVVDPEEDEQRVHDKTKMILGLLGWTMLDEQKSTLSYTAAVGSWALGVFDFSISTQLDSRTGKNFPPGTRGQDAMATSGGKVVRLGSVIGHELIKHAQAPKTDVGAGKTAAPGQVLKEKYGRDDKK